MLTDSQQSCVALPPHCPPNGTQRPADAHDFRFNQDLFAERYWLEVCHVQRPAHSKVEPEPRFVYKSQRHRRHKVKETGNVSTVGIAQPVTIVFLDSILRHIRSVHHGVLRAAWTGRGCSGRSRPYGPGLGRIGTEPAGTSSMPWANPHFEYCPGMLWLIQRPRVKLQKGETARHPVLAQAKGQHGVAPGGREGITLAYLPLWVLVLQTRVLEP